MKRFTFPILLAAAAVAPAQTPGMITVAPTGPGQPAPAVIAIPPLTTPKNVGTDAGDTALVAYNVGDLIAADLRSSGLFLPLAKEVARPYSYPETTAPSYPKWRAIGAKTLLTGFVQAGNDGRLTVGCYVYDVAAGRELGRQGFRISAGDWRRAAHKCAGLAYEKVVGTPGMFDSRIAYVAETGSPSFPVKRLAIMDTDGAEHDYLTQGATTVLTPRFSPDGSTLAYVSYEGRTPRVRLMDIETKQDRLLVNSPAMSFSPAFSPDGRQIAFSMSNGGNSDIYVVSANGGFPQRLTGMPGTDTSPSFSPDGSRIAFESDRGGSQQLYVMDSNGANQRRISFGGFRYASPAWSPAGDVIAFVRLDGANLRIGVMNANGSGERLLTDGWQDERPTWAPNGEHILFQRTNRSSGRTSLLSVPVSGGVPRLVTIPTNGSDPAWSALRD